MSKRTIEVDEGNNRNKYRDTEGWGRAQKNQTARACWSQPVRVCASHRLNFQEFCKLVNEYGHYEKLNQKKFQLPALDLKWKI